MKHKNVKSSNIKSIGYDEDSQILEVRFLKGGLYQYLGVPPEEHQALMASGSCGSCLSDRIKGRYRYVRVGN